MNNETRLKFIVIIACFCGKVIEDSEKPFIVMPSKKIKDDQWTDICQECRAVLENISLLEQLPDDFEIVNEVK